MLNFGQTIPAGYAIQIESWENDGDDYSRQYFYGLTKADIEQFAHVLPLFKSCHGWKESGLGNKEFSEVAEELAYSYAELIRDGKINLEFATKYLGFNVLDVGLVFEAEWGEEFEEMMAQWAESRIGLTYIREILGYSDSGYDDFVRVFESAKVMFFEKELRIPDVKFEKLL